MLLIELPVVRTPRRDRVPLRRPGPRALPGGPGRPLATRSGRSTCSTATTRRASSPSAGSHGGGCRQWFNVVRDTATYEVLAVYTGTRDPRPRSAPAQEAPDEHPVPPAPDGRPDRPRPVLSVHRRRRRATPATPATPSPRRCWPTAGSRSAPSIYRGRPRGILAAGVEEPNALVQVGGDCSEPMVPATVRELVDGLAATHLSGLGGLDPRPTTARLRQEVRAHRRPRRSAAARPGSPPRGAPPAPAPASS